VSKVWARKLRDVPEIVVEKNDCDDEQSIGAWRGQPGGASIGTKHKDRDDGREQNLRIKRRRIILK